MHRIENNALIVSCDYCGTDWDGASPVIEGHRGAIICLECLKLALSTLAIGENPFKCTLCLRESIPASVPRFNHPNHPETFACKSCIHQTAEVFDKDPDIDWKWENKPI
jgi:hypothetical protein